MAAPSWSSLPGDLINLVADSLLATNDLDSYVDLRAVCHGWRSNTADPRKSPRDPRFQPRRWAMLDEAHQTDSDSDSRLFVNVATGRFVRKHLPLLRRKKYFFVTGACGGWLVLAERRSPHAACLLNPLTGSMAQFMAPVPPELEDEVEVAAQVIGSSLTLILLRHSLSITPATYWAADPSSKSFVMFEEKHCDDRLASQALVGGIWAGGGLEHASSLGALLHPAVRKISGLVGTMPPFTNELLRRQSRKTAWRYSFLVESAGEILIVFTEFSFSTMKACMEVFKMASGGNALEPVKNIGNRAIFVGDRRSLSVDAEKFACVQANCIYYVEDLFMNYHVYSLEDDKDCTFSSKDCPFSVVQLLCRYTSRWIELDRQFLRACFGCGISVRDRATFLSTMK